MLTSSGDYVSVEATTPLQEEHLIELADSPYHSVTPQSIRTSLRASTIDGVFAAIFINIAGGVLLSNFLVELDASTVQIGLLAAIPMVVNLIQPLGAYLADRTASRHRYGLWIFAPSRLVWLVLVLGIMLFTWQQSDLHQLIYWTLGVMIVSNTFAALGSASWLSWLAALVPRQLRGRYFGWRNSAVNLTVLISLPLAGFGVSAWPGGSIQGYGVILLLGILAGIVSISFQFFMQDVNPQIQRSLPKNTQRIQAKEAATSNRASEQSHSVLPSFWRDTNFLVFLLYFGFWAFAINLSSPFFNIYLLDNLALDIKWVTLYNSLASGATLLMLIVWGKLSDRVGNQPLLLGIGILVALTPLLWLGIGVSSASLWFWLPLLHIFIGGTWPAIELCSNNIQMEIAPIQQHSAYFAIAAAVAGGMGALGTVAGGYLAQFADYGGLKGMFVFSSVLRLVALLPLILVKEQQGKLVTQVVRALGAAAEPEVTLPAQSSGEDLELNELHCDRTSTVVNQNI